MGFADITVTGVVVPGEVKLNRDRKKDMDLSVGRNVIHEEQVSKKMHTVGEFEAHWSCQRSHLSNKNDSLVLKKKARL